MKICFLIQWLQAGGAERTIVTLSDYLVRHNYDVDIVMLGDIIDYEVNNRVNIFTVDKFTGPEGFSAIRHIGRRRKAISRYIEKNSPDIIVSFLAPMLMYLNNPGIPVVCSERSNPKKERGYLKRKVTEYLYARSDCIVFQTQRVAACFPDKIRKKGVVIGNPIGNLYAGEKPLFADRKEKISAMGRLVPAKDYPTLFKAFAEVVKTHPDCKLDIYGNGPLRAELEQLAKRLSIQNSVNFCGVRKDALQSMFDSKCFVLSSIYEGLPNALIEAMAAGIPCVSTDCDFGPDEIIEDNVNGILVPAGDCGKMADAIGKMLDDEKFADSCTKNSGKIFDKFSSENICGMYVELFGKVINAFKEKNHGL